MGAYDLILGPINLVRLAFPNDDAAIRPDGVNKAIVPTFSSVVVPTHDAVIPKIHFFQVFFVSAKDKRTAALHSRSSGVVTVLGSRFSATFGKSHICNLFGKLFEIC